MSRTDVHRPAWVQEHDPTMGRDFVVQHNHFVQEHWDPVARRYLVRRVAPCDLHVWEQAGCSVLTRCRPRFTGRGNPFCGCVICTGKRGRRYQQGQRRAAWRADRQRLLGGQEERPARRYESWF